MNAVDSLVYFFGKLLIIFLIGVAVYFYFKEKKTEAKNEERNYEDGIKAVDARVDSESIDEQISDSNAEYRKTFKNK